MRQVTAIPWYRDKDTYERCKSLFSGQSSLHPSFEKWLKAAQEQVKFQESLGFEVVKAHIDPDLFPKWCRDRGMEIDSHARVEFAEQTAWLHANAG